MVLRSQSLAMKLALHAVWPFALAIAGCAGSQGVRVPAGKRSERRDGVEHGWTVVGAEIFGQWWRPDEPRAVLVVVHGLKDHGGRYAELGQYLAARGVAVYAMDLRGHGRSAGPREAIDSFDAYLDDLDAWLAEVIEREPGRPVFLLGHGMGGAIAALYAIERKRDLRGLILSAPALRLDVWPMTVALRRMVSSILPAGPARTAGELVGGIQRIWAGLTRLDAPLLVLHGTADRLTHPGGSQQLVAMCRCKLDRTLRTYPGAWHDLLHDPSRAWVMSEIPSWIDARTAEPISHPVLSVSGPREASPLHPSSSLLLAARYTGSDGGGALEERRLDIVAIDVRTRLAIGDRLPLCAGLDATLGASSTGMAYGADLYLFGFVAPSIRFGTTPLWWTACGGVGLSGVRGSIPFGWEFPGELALHTDFGSVHLRGWARAAVIANAEGRRDGTEVANGWPDEYSNGFEIRFGRTRRYWGTTFAGGGPVVGLMSQDVMGASFWGVYLGVGASGLELR